MTHKEWYALLNKPAWAPPSSVYAPVWVVLYVVITITFGHVFYLFFTGLIPFAILVPFMLNLIFNFLHSPIQFEFKNNYLALLVDATMWVTLVWGMVVILLYEPWVMILNIPYLLWVTFACILQYSIAKRNGISL